MSEPHWRGMRADDLPAVMRVAADIHPDYFERDAVFAERLALDAAGCHVFIADGSVCGYVVSHPWSTSHPPLLDSLLGGLPDAPTCYYIHDIALLPDARGRGAASDAIAMLEGRAAELGLGQLALVATPAALPYWRAKGFEVAAADSDALRSYGDGAAFMTRPIRRAA